MGQRGFPIVDTVLALTDLAGVVYVASRDNIDAKGTRIVFGTSLAALWALSAEYGYRLTGECRAAQEEGDWSPPAATVHRRVRRAPQPPPAEVSPPPPPAPIGPPAPASPPAPGSTPAPTPIDGGQPPVDDTPRRPPARQRADEDDP